VLELGWFFSSLLREDDWSRIANAFEDNHDPRFGDLQSADLDRLLTDIANLAARKREQL
jgi:hypothetical protein